MPIQDAIGCKSRMCGFCGDGFRAAMIRAIRNVYIHSRFGHPDAVDGDIEFEEGDALARLWRNHDIKIKQN